MNTRRALCAYADRQPRAKKFSLPRTPESMLLSNVVSHVKICQMLLATSRYVKMSTSTLNRGAGRRIFFRTGRLGCIRRLKQDFGERLAATCQYIAMLCKDITGNAFPCAGRAFRAVAMPSHLDAFSRGAIVGMAAAGASSASIAAVVKKPDKTHPTIRAVQQTIAKARAGCVCGCASSGCASA